MTKHGFGVGVISCLLAALTTTGATAAFSPLFQVADVSGACAVQAPGDAAVRPLQGGEGLAYGSIIRTGADSALALLLSTDNKILVGPNTVVNIQEDPDNASLKILQLFKGRIEPVLEKDFQNANGLHVAIRCVVINFQTGGSASIEAATEADLKVTTIACKGSQLELRGPGFVLPVLKDSDSLSVACSDDLSFIRLRNLDGTYTVQLRDSTDAERLAEMQKDSVIKIMRKVSETDASIMIITVLDVGPDGNVIQADTYEEPAATAPGTLNSDDPIPGSEIPGAKPDEAPAGTFPTTTSSTTTSTTTTTVPPGDTIPPTTTTVTPPTTTRPPPPPTTRPDATPRGRR